MELVDGRRCGGFRQAACRSSSFFDSRSSRRRARGGARRGIIHRDLKPANVMVTRRRPREGARLRPGEARRDVAAPTARRCMPTRATDRRRQILGTVAYMSPEQAEGKPVDRASDLFSLGVVLYEMATGERPFRGDNSVSVLSSILQGRAALRSPSSSATSPSDLSRLIRRCLEKDPGRRIQTGARSSQRAAGSEGRVRHQRPTVGRRSQRLPSPRRRRGWPQPPSMRRRRAARRDGLWRGLAGTAPGRPPVPSTRSSSCRSRTRAAVRTATTSAMASPTA